MQTVIHYFKQSKFQLKHRDKNAAKQLNPVRIAIVE